jgi:hypothetical protein
VEVTPAWRTSGPLVLTGLAHQVMVPEVALPGADDGPPLTGAVLPRCCCSRLR